MLTCLTVVKSHIPPRREIVQKLEFVSPTPNFDNTGIATLSWNIAATAPVAITWTPQIAGLQQPIIVEAGTTSTTINGFSDSTYYTFTITTQDKKPVAITSSPILCLIITSGSLGLRSTSSSFGFTDICCSSSGKYMFASSTNGIYVSSTYGRTFTQQLANKSVKGVDCSNSGEVVYVNTQISGIYQVYRSGDYGQSFTYLSSVANNDPESICCDGTGTYLLYRKYGSAVKLYDHSKTRVTTLISNVNYGFIGIGMAKNGNFIIQASNRRGIDNNARVEYTTVPYADLSNDVSPAFVLINRGKFDLNCVRFGVASDGSYCYMPVLQYSNGVWKILNTTTTINLEDRIPELGTIPYLSATVLQEKNFAAIGTTNNTELTQSLIYYTQDNGVTWTSLTFPYTKNGAQIHLTSFIISPTRYALVITSAANSAGVLSYIQVFSG